MIWELVRPRRGLLALSFLLLLIGRLCGLVLPAAPKYLMDDVIGKHRADLLLPLVAGGAGRDLDSGSHIVYADAASFQRRPSV